MAKEGRSSRMYGKGPKLERGEDGHMSVKKHVEKEKEVYQKNKEHKKEVTARNMKKYLTFYKMYKDKHPEFEKELDSEKGSE